MFYNSINAVPMRRMEQVAVTAILSGESWMHSADANLLEVHTWSKTCQGLVQNPEPGSQDACRCKLSSTHHSASLIEAAFEGSSSPGSYRGQRTGNRVAGRLYKEGAFKVIERVEAGNEDGAQKICAMLSLRAGTHSPGKTADSLTVQ